MAHADEFTFCGHEQDLRCVKENDGMSVRRKGARLVWPWQGRHEGDYCLCKDFRLERVGNSYQADPSDMRFILEHLRLAEGLKAMITTGAKMDVDSDDEGGDAAGIVFDTAVAKAAWASAARINLIALDC